MNFITLELDNLYEIFPHDIRGELFIRIRRSYFEEMIWRDWPKATKAIVPVIMKHSDARGYSFPSQTRIAIYAGITKKTVRQGLSELKIFQDFDIKREFNRRGWMKNKYWFKPTPRNEKGAVFISHAFFNGGNWSLLSPTAKAIYPVLKYFCFWDFDLYQEYEATCEDPSEFNEVYCDRKFDFLSADPEAIAELSGVSKKSITSAFQSLENHHFMESIGMMNDRETWKLFTKPPHIYKSTYMNEQVRNKYNLMENITY
jgi:hypothetical protein